MMSAGQDESAVKTCVLPNSNRLPCFTARDPLARRLRVREGQSLSGRPLVA